MNTHTINADYYSILDIEPVDKKFGSGYKLKLYALSGSPDKIIESYYAYDELYLLPQFLTDTKEVLTIPKKPSERLPYLKRYINTLDYSYYLYPHSTVLRNGRNQFPFLSLRKEPTSSKPYLPTSIETELQPEPFVCIPNTFLVAFVRSRGDSILCSIVDVNTYTTTIFEDIPTLKSYLDENPNNIYIGCKNATLKYLNAIHNNMSILTMTDHTPTPEFENPLNTLSIQNLNIEHRKLTGTQHYKEFYLTKKLHGRTAEETLTLETQNLVQLYHYKLFEFVKARLSLIAKLEVNPATSTSLLCYELFKKETIETKPPLGAHQLETFNLPISIQASIERGTPFALGGLILNPSNAGLLGAKQAYTVTNSNIVHIDINSAYATIMAEFGMYPYWMDETKFNEILNRRLALKSKPQLIPSEKLELTNLKSLLNLTVGSCYSELPNLNCMRDTVAYMGVIKQLQLLMTSFVSRTLLIGAKLLAVNTDGFYIELPKEKMEDLNYEVMNFIDRYNLKITTDIYTDAYFKTNNSYIVINSTAPQSYKYKGDFKWFQNHTYARELLNNLTFRTPITTLHPTAQDAIIFDKKLRSRAMACEDGTLWEIDKYPLAKHERPTPRALRKYLESLL